MFKIATVYFVLAATLHAVVSSPLDTSVESLESRGGSLYPCTFIQSKLFYFWCFALDAWSDRVLSLHNSNRARYGANALQWASDLYPGALSWAQQCKFSHR